VGAGSHKNGKNGKIKKYEGVSKQILFKERCKR
jgi:hypothetical protein